MLNYDFRTLNDKEFEVLCADLLSEFLGVRIERFKPGRDKGVDGRFFSEQKNETIIQCKHWINTPIQALIQRLKVDEKPKVDKLVPHRYILAVSHPLSRADKALIRQAFSPHVATEGDIFGQEDLNDLLARHPSIERRHYKLWLRSAAVLDHIFHNAILGRSEFSLNEIAASAAVYAVTENHRKALEMLDRLGVVIITGEPGVGKTTLANHLCLDYVAKGFEFIKIADEISEAEAVIRDGKDQLFYFDDFLGQNYLEALKGHEGSHIAQFIRRIGSNRSKRFILTSRSTILNQGKFLLDSYQHSNLNRNEFELRITSLSELDRAHILYNHIWHSSLPQDFIEELYAEKRYKIVIAHRNFNPRLVQYVTDVTRLDNVCAEDYWQYVEGSFENPSQIWENPFLVQQDDYGRALVLMVVFCGRWVEESLIAEAYSRYIAMPENQGMQGRREFQSNIRLLTGSFLTRTIVVGAPVRLSLFNPSIGDFVLKRYAADVPTLRIVLYALRSYAALSTLRSLRANRLVTDAEETSIHLYLLEKAVTANFSGFTSVFLAALCDQIEPDVREKEGVRDQFLRTVQFLLSRSIAAAADDFYNVLRWTVERELVSGDDALQYVEATIDSVKQHWDFSAIGKLVECIDASTQNYDAVLSRVKNRVVEEVSERFDDFIEVNEVFSSLEEVDYREAEREVRKLIRKELEDLHVSAASEDVQKVLDAYDVKSAFEDYFREVGRTTTQAPEMTLPTGNDAVDDLFDRN
jgi:hypothetical protein